MFLIFRENFTTDRLAPLELTPEERRHLRARRLKADSPLVLGDGGGRRWNGRLSADGSQFLPEQGEPEEFRAIRELTIATALPSGNRWDLLLQKGTELGVTRFIPLACDRSDRRELSSERSRKIIVEAAAQSRSFYLPRLESVTEVRNLSQLLGEDDEVIVLDRSGDSSLSEYRPGRGRPVLVVGPEGGFSADELSFAREQKWSVHFMVENILRIETAALAGAAYLAITGEVK